jgi:predicted permease
MISSSPKSEAPIKRPGLVWVILAVYAVGLIVFFGSMYAVFSGRLQLPTAEAGFYARFGTVNFLGLALSAVLSSGFMVQLFRMRISAAYFASAGLVVLIVKDFYYQPQLVRLGHSLIPAIIGVIISFLIVCYTWHLKRTGSLR